MNDDIEVYLDSATTGSSYLESIIKAYERLSHIHNVESPLIKKITQLIEEELDLALLGTSKAKSEILKATKDNVKPINPGAA